MLEMILIGLIVSLAALYVLRKILRGDGSNDCRCGHAVCPLKSDPFSGSNGEVDKEERSN